MRDSCGVALMTISRAMGGDCRLPALMPLTIYFAGAISGGRADVAHYRRVDSLREYLLVSQDERLVEHYARDVDGSWRLTTWTAGDAVPIPSARHGSVPTLLHALFCASRRVPGSGRATKRKGPGRAFTVLCWFIESRGPQRQHGARGIWRIGDVG